MFAFAPGKAPLDWDAFFPKISLSGKRLNRSTDGRSFLP
jgi:hypothetical protein